MTTLPNNLTQQELTDLLYRSFYETGDAAGFVTSFTDLFIGDNGIPYKLYPKQVAFLNHLSPFDRLIVMLKIRQSGISTSIVGKCVYESYFKKIPEIGIISATKSQAVKVLRRIKESFNNMPDGIRPDFKVENAQHLQLQNGANIYSLSSNPRQMRGWTGTFFCDEFAIHGERDSEIIYEAIFPSISTNKNARLIFVSTPLGSRGMFWKLATKSLKEISGNEGSKKISVLQKKVFKIRWTDVPHIVNAVENEGLFDGLPESSLKQEYLLQFLDEMDEAFFSYQFLMDNFNKKESDDLFAKIYQQHFYESYEDLGIPDNFIEDLDMPLTDNYVLYNLQKTYKKIVAGWDIASSRDDSILVVIGERRDKSGYWEIIGDFVLNKKIKKGDNTGIVDNTFDQAKYVRRILKAMMVEQLTIDNTSIGIPVGDILESFEEVEPILNKFTYTRDKKVAGMARIKDMITGGRLKRKFDNDNRDREVISQMTNLYIKGGKIIDKTRNVKGKSSKDDYPNAIMLATEEVEGIESGFVVIESASTNIVGSGDLNLKDWKRFITDDEQTVRQNLLKIRDEDFTINGRKIF